MNKQIKNIFLGALTALLFLPIAANAQMLSANTDVLWDAAMSPNIGFELTVANKTTLQVNALTSQKPYGKDLRVTAVQPEYRYYFSGRPMYKHFVGLSAFGAVYKATIKDKNYNGSAAGAGITFGYVMPLGKRLNVDFHAGMGVAKYRQKEYYLDQEHNKNAEGYEEANANGWLLVPTRIGVSLSYILK